jgi:phosphoribosylglycinamide formyltransferase 1
MKIVILTSDEIRHKFLANSLSSKVDEALVISEYKQNIDLELKKTDPKIFEHFELRDKTEKSFFPNSQFFMGNTLSIKYKEVNLDHIFQKVKYFEPDFMFIFGSSIIREPLLSLLPSNHVINLHLGLSPYYRGSGTNFWPFVNNELEYVGSTILHLDSGIDTGNIICHTTPTIELGDNVHTVGCKVIQSSVDALIKIIDIIDQGKKLNSIKQWAVDGKYCKTNDFNNDILLKYKNNLENGLIENYLKQPNKKIKLIDLITDE